MVSSVEPVSDGGGQGRPHGVAGPDFESFFAVSLDLMVIRDAALRIVKVNEAWETVLGYRPEELEGRPMLDLIHPDDLIATRNQMGRAKVETQVASFINRYRCKDGGYRHFEWRARQVGDLVYGVARDVTDRLAVEAAMVTARENAEAANRAKSEFLANMSHEIRTPLNGVIGIAAALSETALSEPQQEMAGLILASGQTLERVVSDVLDLSKIEAGRLTFELQPFDLRTELDGLMDLFRGRAESKGLAFRVAYGEGAHGRLNGDVVRIKQVLGNLVSNAVKFTAEGEVAIAVDLETADAPDRVVLTLDVRDTGIGFDTEAAARLFQRFNQADGSITRRFGGSGLGLSICQALIEMMGGEIFSRSEPGRGSRFEVRLPLERLEAGSAAEAGPRIRFALPAATGGEGPLRVLLADDHPVNRRVVELILEPAGAAFVTAKDGAEALDAYRTGSFSVVLMDMQMPGMDGLAATRAIRALEAETPGGRRTPIIMLTANAMRHHEEEALAAGADLHLPKPITPASLFAAIRRAVPAAG